VFRYTASMSYARKYTPTITMEENPQMQYTESIRHIASTYCSRI
jgi:hypothetical protein